MAQKYAVGWVQKDKCGDTYRYVSYYLTNEVDINELMNLESDNDVQKKIGDRFKNQFCDWEDFITKFENGTEIHYILEHENGNRWKMNLTMVQKNNLKPIRLSYLEEFDTQVRDSDYYYYDLQKTE